MWFHAHFQLIDPTLWYATQKFKKLCWLVMQSPRNRLRVFSSITRCWKSLYNKKFHHKITLRQVNFTMKFFHNTLQKTINAFWWLNDVNQLWSNPSQKPSMIFHYPKCSPFSTAKTSFPCEGKTYVFFDIKHQKIWAEPSQSHYPSISLFYLTDFTVSH